MSVLLVFVVYAVWSSVFSLGKMALEFSPPVFLTGSRMLLAAVLILGYLAIRKPSQLKINSRQLLSLTLLGFFSIYLPNICEFWGLQYLSAAKTCFLYSLSPFFACLFSYLHFGEKINLKKFIGLLIGFVGFFPVLLMQDGSKELLTSLKIISWPELAIMGAALFSVYGWVLLRLTVKDQSTSPLVANGYSMWIGGTMALVHSLFVDSWNPIPIAAGGVSPFLIGVISMTFISNILCYNLYGMLLKRFTATFLSFAGLLSPIFASCTSWIILGEKPSPVIFISTAVVLFGLWIVYQSELKQGYIITKKKEEEPAST